jgi:hypothetical protein
MADASPTHAGHQVPLSSSPSPHSALQGVPQLAASHDDGDDTAAAAANPLDDDAGYDGDEDPVPPTPASLAGFSALSRVPSRPAGRPNTVTGPVVRRRPPGLAAVANLRPPRVGSKRRGSCNVPDLQLPPEELEELIETYMDLKASGASDKEISDLIGGVLASPGLSTIHEERSVDMRIEQETEQPPSPPFRSPVVAESSAAAEARAAQAAAEAAEEAEAIAAIAAIAAAMAQPATAAAAGASGGEEPAGATANEEGSDDKKKKRKRAQNGKAKAKGKPASPPDPSFSDHSSSSSPSPSDSDSHRAATQPPSPPAEQPAVPLPPGTNAKQAAVMRYFLTTDALFRERYLRMARDLSVVLQLVRRGCKRVNGAAVVAQVHWVERYLYAKVVYSPSLVLAALCRLFLCLAPPAFSLEPPVPCPSDFGSGTERDALSVQLGKEARS